MKDAGNTEKHLIRALAGYLAIAALATAGAVGVAYVLADLAWRAI